MWKPPIKSNPNAKKKPPKNPIEILVENLQSKIAEATQVIEKTSLVAEEIKVDTEKKTDELKSEVKDFIENIELPKGEKGDPGDDAEPVDAEQIVQEVISRLPEPQIIDPSDIIEKVIAQLPPPPDLSKLRASIIRSLPTKAGSLKIIRENVEIDPAMILEKILALPEDKFKIKTTQIEGLEEKIKAFWDRYPRGYLHGGGDTVIAGTNVTITTNSAGQKVISSALGIVGVSSLNGLKDNIILAAGSNITITPSGNTLTISASTGTVTSVSVVTANGISGSVADSSTTPAITLTLGAITPSSVAAIGTVTGSNLSGTNTGDQTISLTGEVTGSGTSSFVTTLTNSAVIGKVLTGYVSGAGTVASTDSILQAIQKLNGNVAALVTGVSSVSGTTNRITTSPTTGAVAVDISASYVGQSSITTLGTIATGVWQGTVINSTYGGTGVNNAGRTLTINTNNGTISFTSAVTLTVANTASVSGTNTGDNTVATSITSRTLWGQTYDGTGNVSGSLTAVANITGGASSMTITAGTGASRTLALQSTTSGSVATTFLTGNADQTTTFAAGILGTGAWSITGGAGNMTIISGTGASRTMIFQTTTSGSTATTALTLNADQTATFAGAASGVSFATSAASPLLLTNGKLVTIALTSQTVNPTTLTIPDFASVSDTFAFITLAQTLTNKTLTTPVINGTITGTGQATAATASTIMMRDASANSTINSLITGWVTTATAAGTTVMVVGDKYQQYWTGSTTQTIKLPTTSVVAGQQWQIVNQSSGLVTVQSSGANTILILAASTSAVFTALVATPTTAANWAFVYEGASAASSGSLTTSGAFPITLTATGSTTVTLPTSGTLVNTAVTALSSLVTVSTITSGGLGTGAVIGGVTMTLGSDATNDMYYRNSSGVLTRFASANSAVLITSGSGVPSISTAIPSGVTATTQSLNDNSTKLATTAYVDTSNLDVDLLVMQGLGSVIKANAFGVNPAQISTAVGINDGVAKYIAIYIPYTQTITGVKWFQSVAGVYTADNNNYVALYSYSGGTLTQRAISSNDGTIWKATSNTYSSAAFTASYSAAPGVYYVGLLYNSSAQTTAPLLGGLTTLLDVGVTGVDFTNSALFQGNVAAQTTLPSSQAASGMTKPASTIWIGVY